MQDDVLKQIDDFVEAEMAKEKEETEDVLGGFTGTNSTAEKIESMQEEYSEETGQSNGAGRKGIYELVEEEIRSLDISEKRRAKKLKRVEELKNQNVNIMLVGSSGSGKSSTINAIFDMNLAKVGEGVDPQTQEIAKFELENLTVWDTPPVWETVLIRMRR